MRRSIAALSAAAVVAVSVGWASGVAAQAQQPKPSPAAPAQTEQKEVVAKIKTVDPTGKRVTLDDGTVLMIPETIAISRADLKPGATVKVAFEEKGGQKVVTSMEVQK